MTTKKTIKTKNANEHDIAIVGMAGMFPGACDIDTFWENIVGRVNSIKEVDPERWRQQDVFDPKLRTQDRTYSKWGGFLDEIAFDPTEFGIPPITLKSVDAAQFLALKAAKEALADAKMTGNHFPGNRMAVIFGAGGMHDQCIDYAFRTMLMHYLPKIKGLTEETREHILTSFKGLLPQWSIDSFPGILSNVIAGRVANRLDINGSNFTVDAACASSLAALDVGIAKLRSGQADAALVGAVDISNNIMGFMVFAQTLVLSPKGKSRPFDESADGIVISEGVGVLVLKRLSDAKKDGNRIHAVIKGIGSSSDGKNRSLTAPHAEGQVLAIQRAYEDAGIDPATVGLMEAHGTGTVVGDQSEFKAMQLSSGPPAHQNDRCAVGSVKSNIGHAKVAAGIAGLIKGVMAMKHKILPATLGIDKPNTKIDFSQNRYYLNTENRPWLKRKDRDPRRCGVSAFGFGGTNFHVVLEEHEEINHKPCFVGPRDVEIFTFSSENKTGLRLQLENLDSVLAESGLLDMRSVAQALYLQTQQPEKQAHRFKLNIVAKSLSELKEKLKQSCEALDAGDMPRAKNGIYFNDHEGPDGKVCFLFPGQGSQKVNMLKDFLIGIPESQAVFEAVDQTLEDWFDQPLSEFVYPVPAFSKKERNHQIEQLNNTRIAQPAMAGADLTALELMKYLRINPEFSAGHSFGEWIALHAAGVISREDVIALAAKRGTLSAKASAGTNGKMAAVRADSDTALKLIKISGTRAQIANINTPQQTVIGGPDKDIDQCLKTAKNEKILAKEIPVTAAFHTDLMTSVANDLSEELKKCKLSSPQFLVFSNTTGKPYPKTVAAIRNLLSRHIKEPIDFITQINNIHDAGARYFIEAGPGYVLSSLVNRILTGKQHTVLTLDNPDYGGTAKIAHFMARVHVLNLSTDLSCWFGHDDLTRARDMDKLIAEAKLLKQPSKQTWRIKNAKATPWYVQTLSGVLENANVKHISKNLNIQSNPNGNPHGNPHGNPIGHPMKYVKKVETTPMKNNDVKKPKENQETEFLQPSSSLIHKIQANLDQFMEMNRSQQHLMNRFLDMQQQILNAALNGNSKAFEKKPEDTDNFVEAPPEKESPPVFSAPKPPAPAIPNLMSVLKEKQTMQNSEPKTQPGSSLVEKAAEKPRQSSGTSDQFQEDLLKTVSDLTGYPVEMLGLDANLEADLGIDSIKRVEIFSILEEHHLLLETHDSDSVLEELANLNSLQKIIDWYNTNRERMKETENISQKKQ